RPPYVLPGRYLRYEPTPAPPEYLRPAWARQRERKRLPAGRAQYYRTPLHVTPHSFAMPPRFLWSHCAGPPRPLAWIIPGQRSGVRRKLLYRIRTKEECP